MSDPLGPEGRDGAGGPPRRRRSETTPRQRRKDQRRAQKAGERRRKKGGRSERTPQRSERSEPTPPAPAPPPTPAAPHTDGGYRDAPDPNGDPGPYGADPAAARGAPAARSAPPPEGHAADARSAAPSPPPQRPGSTRAGRAARRRSRDRRTQVERRDRRQRRARTTVLLVVLGLLVAGAVVFVTGLFDRALDLVTAEDPETEAIEPGGDLQPSLVVVTHDEDDPSAGASRVFVLASDRTSGDGAALLVPSATIVNVPGRGSFELGEAHTLGGGALVSASLENLLGARFDGTLELSVQQWAAVLQHVDGFDVDVRSRLVQLEEDGGEVRFEPGAQFLDGPRLAEYLAFRAQGESELDALLRVQQIVNGLLDRLASEPEAMDRLFADDGVLAASDDPDLVRTVLTELRDARQDDGLVVLTLPVSPLGGGQDVYQVETERMEELVDQYFAASRPSSEVGAGRALQILNGNGAPGIGEDVTARLRDGGYRVVLTGNADNFDHDTTRIVVYEETAQQVAIAQDIQTRLGVGEIVRSEVPQSVVDITVIVGHDYLEAQGDE